jgi:hypothetical protein
MFSTAQKRTCNQVKYSRAKFEGMEGGLPLLSRAWERAHVRNTYIVSKARRNSVDKLESIAS